MASGLIQFAFVLASGIINIMPNEVGADGENYETAICRFLFAYRNAEHCTTQKEPAVAILGRRLRGRLDLIRPSTADVVQHKQSVQEAHAGGSSRDFTPGEHVLVRSYNNKGIKWKTGTVLDKISPVSYKVMTDNDQVAKRHADQLISNRKSRYSLPCTEEVSDNHVQSSLGQSPSSNKFSSPMNISSEERELEVVNVGQDNSDESFHTPTKERQHQNCIPHKMTLRPRVKK
ncbi:hypothetical protein ACJJTC_016264 [Scirpophaga incertulas]